MAWKKAYRKKRYHVSRTNKSVATKGWVKSTIKKNIELKEYHEDLVRTYNSISTTWTDFDLTKFAGGVSESYRIGSQVTVKSVEFYGILCGGQAMTSLDDTRNTVRIIMSDSRNATPMTGVVGVGMNDPILPCHDNPNIRKKYMDKYIPLASPGVCSPTGFMPVLKVVKFKKVFKGGYNIQFKDNNSTSGDRHIVLSMLSDSLVSTHPGFVNGYWTIKYTDA